MNEEITQKSVCHKILNPENLWSHDLELTTTSYR